MMRSATTRITAATCPTTTPTPSRVASAFRGRCFSAEASHLKAEEDSSRYVAPSDFVATNIYNQGIPFFGENTMATVRASPALFKKSEDGKYISDIAGSLYFSFLRRDPGETKYDRDSRLSVRVRGVDIGGLLEFDPATLTETKVIGGFGSLEVSPSETAGHVKMTGRYKPRDGDERELSVEVATGQFKTMQAIITQVAPALFGWQTLMDPSLARLFMERPLPNSVEAKSEDFFGK